MFSYGERTGPHKRGRDTITSIAFFPFISRISYVIHGVPVLCSSFSIDDVCTEAYWWMTNRWLVEAFFPTYMKYLSCFCSSIFSIIYWLILLLPVCTTRTISNVNKIYPQLLRMLCGLIIQHLAMIKLWKRWITRHRNSLIVSYLYNLIICDN